MKSPYYVPITDDVEIVNPEVVLHHLSSQWHGEAVSSKNHIRVWIYECRNPMIAFTPLFHEVSFFSMDPSRGHRRCKLHLKGKRDKEDIFAVLDFAMPALPLSVKPTDVSIILSPLPFGLDGRVKLPYVGDQLETFLIAAKSVLLSDTSEVSYEDVSGDPSWLPRMVMLGMVSSHPSGRLYHVEMTPQQFVRTFGVELP